MHVNGTPAGHILLLEVLELLITSVEFIKHTCKACLDAALIARGAYAVTDR